MFILENKSMLISISIDISGEINLKGWNSHNFAPGKLVKAKRNNFWEASLKNFFARAGWPQATHDNPWLQINIIHFSDQHPKGTKHKFLLAYV